MGSLSYDGNTNGVGRLRFTLDKSGDVSTHNTASVGEAVETYVLKVFYEPWESVMPEQDYHTGDRVTGRRGYTSNSTNASENTHVINVYAKPLDILKYRMQGSTKVAFTYDVEDGDKADKQAVFEIFRAWDPVNDPLTDPGESRKVVFGTDEGYTDYMLNGSAMAGAYFLVDAQTTGADGVAHFGDSVGNTKLFNNAKDPCYLIEKKAPKGYEMDVNVKTITIVNEDDNDVKLNLYTRMNGQSLSAAEITSASGNGTPIPYNWNQAVQFRLTEFAGTEEEPNKTVTAILEYVDKESHDEITLPVPGAEEPYEEDDLRTPVYVFSDISNNKQMQVDPKGVFVTEYLNRIAPIDITFKKVDGDGRTGLSGAVFQLLVDKSGNGNYIKVSPDDEYKNITGVSAELIVTTDEEEGTTQTFESAFLTTGTVQILSKLPPGTYKLKELYVPKEYVNTLGDIIFKIDDGKMTMVTEVEPGGKIGFTPATDGTVPTSALLTIANEPGAELPSAGGPGTYLIYLLGIMLIGFAGAGLVMMRRKRKVA